MPEMAACGEIVYEIVRLMTPVTQEIALPLYVAVSTDTGCFVYSNTSAHTHRVAAALLETGIAVAGGEQGAVSHQEPHAAGHGGVDGGMGGVLRQ